MPLPPSPSAEIVGDVGHDDGRLGALDADAADRQLHAVLLLREDVLDARPHRGFPGVGLGGALRHRLAGRFLSMNRAALAAVGQVFLIRLRPLGGVPPNFRGGTAGIDQAFVQPRTVVRRGVGQLLPADEAVPLVDADVALAAEFRDREVALDGAPCPWMS